MVKEETGLKIEIFSDLLYSIDKNAQNHRSLGLRDSGLWMNIDRFRALQTPCSSSKT